MIISNNNITDSLIKYYQNQLTHMILKDINQMAKQNQERRTLTAIWLDNKQNIACENDSTAKIKDIYSKHNQMQQGNRIQILTQSALSALVQKQQIIENLITQDQTTTSNCYNQLSQEIQDLRYQLQALTNDKDQLQEILQFTENKWKQERIEWQLEHSMLLKQIKLITDQLAKTNSENEELSSKLIELHNQNSQIFQELSFLKEAYNQMKIKNLALQQMYFQIPTHTQQIRFIEYLETKQKTINQVLENQQDQCIFNSKETLPQAENTYPQNAELNESFLYETEGWFMRTQSENNSVEQKQHCLQKSLKKIKLIQNYSIMDKDNFDFDVQSQFTNKYFNYQHQSYLFNINQQSKDIPEQPQCDIMQPEQIKCKQMLGKQTNSMDLWGKTGVLVGVCLGAWMIWRFIK